MKLYPDTKRTIGPSIDNGFYFDFEFSHPISEEHFPEIEKTMHELSATWKGFQKHELSSEEAKKEYPNNPYKFELIEEFTQKGKEKVSFYKSGDYWDLCKGGHIEHPDKELRFFKLLSVAGAYWRGNEKNTMLTRIYGTCFPSQEELDTYLAQLEDAKMRDHKKLGKELALFTFSETVGKGLPLWTPKGATVRRELERFIVDEELKRGYLHVNTPDIARLALYEKSGHYPYYKDSMYAPITIDDEQYMLRPMTCPHHFELYLSEKHSYRELPLRYAELAQLYRYEQSGELMGLLRVRTFCLADAHIVCRRSQAETEINNVLDLIDSICGVLGLTMGKDYRYRLSLGDRSDDKKYFKDDAAWDEAETILKNVLVKRNASFFEAQQEAAFYGPKIDIQMRNVNGKEDTAFTVQYDFVMPKRFKLSYTNEEGIEEEPIVVHRSSIGAIERSMAFLIERYSGAFPLWLSPVQVTVLPITDGQVSYARNIEEQMKQQGIRVTVDDRNERLQLKIREAQKEKIPYMLIVGKQEALDTTVSVRSRGKSETSDNKEQIIVSAFIEKVKREIQEKLFNQKV
jgi:threonyl-tRNA synthetase